MLILVSLSLDLENFKMAILRFLKRPHLSDQAPTAKCSELGRKMMSRMIGQSATFLHCSFKNELAWEKPYDNSDV